MTGSRVSLETWSVPLVGLTTLLPPVQFANGFVLMPLNEPEKAAVRRRIPWDAMRVPWYDFDHRVRFHLTAPARLEDDALGLRSNVGEILTALRLVRDGGISAPLASAPNGWFRLDEFQPVPGGFEYTLEQSDVAPLHSVLAEIATVRTLGRLSELRFAMRRLNISYAREDKDDILVDLVIALESSLLHPGVKTDELRARFSGRGAQLLKGIRAPETTARMLKQIYDARSAIVHTGVTLEELFSLPPNPRSKSALKYWWDLDAASGNSPRGPMGVLGDARQFVREVILVYLQRLKTNATLEAINQDLDQLISAANASATPGTSVPGAGGTMR